MAQYVNPIYDTVFKYIMQDEKVAKILIGNTLNFTIKSISMIDNNNCATMQNGQTTFQLNFSATIIDKNGHEQFLHIEVKKALEQGEIMRFRQNIKFLRKGQDLIKNNGNKDHQLSKYTIYILSPELVEDLDYSVFNGLTHKITFVIAPLTKKNVKTHLDKLLSIFSECDPYNPQRMIEIDEFFDDSDDYRTIMKALQKASVDAQLRGNLDLEQYAYKKYLNLENEINELQEQIAEKDRKTAQKLFAIGQSVEEIAEFLSADVEKIKEYLK